MGPKAEKGSCRKNKRVSELLYCPPCWEQHHKSPTFYKYNNIATTGCCFVLYPEKAVTWNPLEPGNTIWKHPNWKWTGSNSNNVNSLSDETKRARVAPSRFEAGPTADAKIFARLANNYESRRQRSRRHQNDTTRIKNVLLASTRQQMSNMILPIVWDELKSTKKGRHAIATVITGSTTISLPTGGTSKSAINKAKKSALAVVSALSSTLAPNNTEEFQQYVVQRSMIGSGSGGMLSTPAELRATTTTGRLLLLSSSSSQQQSNPSVIPMHPRSPTNTAILPKRKRPNEEDNAMICHPCSTTTTTTTNFQRPVTIESLDEILPSDSDSSDSDNESITSEASSSSDEDSISLKENHSGRQSRCNRRKAKYVKKKLSRKSMKGVSEKAIQEVRNSLGTELIQFMKDNCKTASDERPFLALVASKHKRKDVNNALDIYINKAEYRNCQIHAKWPGALKPVKKHQSFKLRIQKDILKELLAFLDAPGNLQRLAYGRQVKDLLNGMETVEMDNVLRSKKITTLTIQFLTNQMREMQLITTKDGAQVPNDKDRCPKLDQKTTFRCLKHRCHDGRCNFTPKGSISPSSVRKLVLAMSPSEIKSLAGLDDTKVTKGRDNFLRLKEIVNLLCEGQLSKDLAKRVDDIEVFYQTDYTNHLSRKGSHKCNCLTCGFNDKDTPTDILCSDRDVHAPSCKKCSDGFAIISTLKEIASDKLHILQQSFAAVDESTTPSTSTPSAVPPPQPPGDTSNTGFSFMSFKELKTACSERDLVQTGSQAAIVVRLVDYENSKETGAPMKWESFTSDFLKKACKERGLTQGGKRDDIILKIKNHDAEQEELERTTIRLRQDLTDDELVALQSASELVREFESRKQDLIDYRSHMARHVSEDKYAAEQVRDLKDDEAIVTSDFKMKILSCYFRENQKKWFGKKGTGCDGFMIMTNPNDEESKAKGIKDVKFVMMLTNDSLQDDWMVACAKFRVYSEYLPSHIKGVHFVSDGAGCFKSQLHRAIQDKWEIWTGVKELTYRLTPAGDGKSSLDGMFGRLNHVLRSSVDEGSSYYNAETIAESIEKSNGLAATQFAIFAPDRSKQLEVEIPTFNFEAVLRTTLDPTRPGGIVAFKHSGYGNGQKVDLVEDVEFLWRKESTDGSTKRAGDVSPIANVYNDDRTLNVQVVNSMKPSCREFLRTENSKSFMTTKLAGKGCGAGNATVRGKKKRQRVEAKSDSKKSDLLKERGEMREAGLFLCDAQCERTGQFCRNIFQLEKAKLAHTKHTFPKGESARDFFLREASKPGGLVEAGARPDRQSTELFETMVAAAEGDPGEADACCFGRFNRKENVVGYKKPPKLLQTLEKLYQEKPQLRAVEFRDRMIRMRDNERGGLLFCYEKRHTNGLLLSIDQIQSWISTRTQQKRKAEKHLKTDKDRQEDALLAKLREERNQ